MLFVSHLACVAGGSGCARARTFLRAVNKAREGISASGEAASEIPACLITYPF